MGAEVEASVLLGRHTVGAVLVRARWVTWGAVLALPKGVGAARRDVRAAGVWVRDLLESLAPKERLALEQGVGEVVESQVGRGLSASEVGTWTSSAGGVELEEEEAVELVEGLEQLVEGEGSVEELVGKVSKVLLRDEGAARTLRSIRALAPGTRVDGQYKVEGLLGAGGFGVVYAVHNVLELTPKPLALKLLRSEEREDKKGERWLKREFALLREHAQEGLARVESLGVCGEHGPYFTMERLEGRTLREWLWEEGRLGVGEGVKVVCKLLETLERLHGKGVTHRDVKPENVFVTGGGRVVLLDLGLAKGESGRRGGETVTGRGQVPGTPHYMSPQRAEGGAASTVDDVYAASVVLFEVLTGESPFAISAGANAFGVAAAIRQGPRCGVRELREEVPMAVGKALGWALEPVVEDRREGSRAEGLRELLEVGLRASENERKASSWFGRLLSWGKGEGEERGSARIKRTTGYKQALEQAKALKGFTFQGVKGRTGRFLGVKGRTGRFLQETTGLVFRLIPGGSYLMGSPEGVGYGDERPQHEVRVEPFLLCESPCTQGAWDRIAKGRIEDTRGWRGEELPIEGVKWNDVRRWCEKAGLRLPSEAEWEYACRAGSVGAYCFGESEEELLDYGWFEDNSGGRTNPVRGKKPNAWGLYDMHGNVLEWCEDDWEDDYRGAPAVGWPARKVAGASERVFRGGCWDYSASSCRAAFRYRFEPGLRDFDLGFRPARSLP